MPTLFVNLSDGVAYDFRQAYTANRDKPDSNYSFSQFYYLDHLMADVQLTVKNRTLSVMKTVGFQNYLLFIFFLSGINK